MFHTIFFLVNFLTSSIKILFSSINVIVNVIEVLSNLEKWLSCSKLKSISQLGSTDFVPKYDYLK